MQPLTPDLHVNVIPLFLNHMCWEYHVKTSLQSLVGVLMDKHWLMPAACTTVNIRFMSACLYFLSPLINNPYLCYMATCIIHVLTDTEHVRGNT